MCYTIFMPNAPKTPTRTLRVEDGLWKMVKEKAASEKKTVTQVIIDFLKEYVS